MRRVQTAQGLASGSHGEGHCKEFVLVKWGSAVYTPRVVEVKKENGQKSKIKSITRIKERGS